MCSLQSGCSFQLLVVPSLFPPAPIQNQNTAQTANKHEKHTENNKRKHCKQRQNNQKSEKTIVPLTI